LKIEISASIISFPSSLFEEKFTRFSRVLFPSFKEKFTRFSRVLFPSFKEKFTRFSRVLFPSFKEKFTRFSRVLFPSKAGAKVQTFSELAKLFFQTGIEN
jgi:hypothetical protein